MLALARICEALMPLVYTGAFAMYALAFFRREDVFERWTRPLLVLSLAIHTLAIYARTMYHGHCLVYSPFEMMTLISFTITLTYLVVELATKERGTGMFFVGLALVLQTFSAMFAPQTAGGPTADPVLLQDVVGLHISAALIGYTAFAISAVYGVLYLMLFHQIRSSRFGTFYNRLPSLQLLEKMGDKSAIIGVIFLAIAVWLAVAYLPDLLPNFSYTDPKMIATILIWAIYVFALALKFFARLEGRKVVILSLVGFVGTILSMTVINLVLSGFHKFN
jgi:ABC-type uncharacterized transport system permease subunit